MDDETKRSLEEVNNDKPVEEIPTSGRSFAQSDVPPEILKMIQEQTAKEREERMRKPQSNLTKKQVKKRNKNKQARKSRKKNKQRKK